MRWLVAAALAVAACKGDAKPAPEPRAPPAKPSFDAASVRLSEAELAPDAAPEACTTEAGVAAKYTAATGTELGHYPCVSFSERFPGVVIVGSLAHDRGCISMGTFADCAFDREVTPREILARAGWADADGERRKQIAVGYIYEIDVPMTGSVAELDPERDAVARNDGSVRVKMWHEGQGGRRRDTTQTRYQYVFSRSGEVTRKQIGTRATKRGDLE